MPALIYFDALCAILVNRDCTFLRDTSKVEWRGVVCRPAVSVERDSLRVEDRWRELKMETRLRQDPRAKVFEARLKTLLPEEYRECYEDVQPVSMGSAGLKFAPDGRVAWNEM